MQQLRKRIHVWLQWNIDKTNIAFRFVRKHKMNEDRITEYFIKFESKLSSIETKVDNIVA